ncbi:DNA recombination protein RmuC [Rhabdaerophilum sp. SD176]|uniref:DNA recombination protein RmuC n=1 Tax=Rhabdaerophilum sp. SD176 TaxID=2983548 RepID=UPI0024DF5616|nr:DNA recombination protein RmuC [Rhabdaerophilum sp. SD176]
MDATLFLLGNQAVTVFHALAGAVGIVVCLLLVQVIGGMRLRRERLMALAREEERQRELDDKVESINRLQSEMAGRMQTLGEILGTRQADLARLVSERMDSVRHSMTSSLTETAQRSQESLAKLQERLAVIDAAQADLKGLTSEVLSLKDVLQNKQARGAYGQGRMEAIVRDALPASAYAFQPTLSNRSRPDCTILLPGDDRPLVIDAKFPLEAFVQLREARSDDQRAAAEKQVRTDLGTHLRDIAGKYLIPGETQDIAMLFVPSEAIYADLGEHFDDVIQKAHRARILIVSPSLLMMAIQVAQSIVRDAAVREQARVIQSELGKLLEDVRRLTERAGKLEQHFRQAQEDVQGILVSSEKVNRRGQRIESLEFEQPNLPASPREEGNEPRLRNVI